MVKLIPGFIFQALGSQAPIVPTKILGDPVELDRHLIENGYAEAFAHPPSNYTSPYIYTGQHTDIQLHVSYRLLHLSNENRVLCIRNNTSKCFCTQHTIRRSPELQIKFLIFINIIVKFLIEIFKNIKLFFR